MKHQKGFSLLEIIVVMAIFLSLFGLVTINTFRAQTRTSLTGTIDTITADVRQQQIKAMVGDTEGRGTIDSYGVHFQSNNYVLFHGTTYNANDTANTTISLDASTAFINNSFPSSNLIFTKGSGEFMNYANGSNTIGIKNIQSNEIKTITINRYGVITQVN